MAAENGLAWDHKSIKIKKEGFVDTKNNTKTWYRVWGDGDIPCIFFHGGPGQSVADYYDTNFEIVNPNLYTIVEVDQLGCGNSQPSVRESFSHVSHYEHTSVRDVVDAMAEVVKAMGWKKVYCHGGSWGSTMCLLFAELYPEMVLGMVMRAVLLGKSEEYDGSFGFDMSKIDDPSTTYYMKGFHSYLKEKGFKGSHQSGMDILSFYMGLLTSGTKEERDMAGWNWWVFELYMMDQYHRKFNEIVEEDLAEARSVAFWEILLFLSLGSEVDINIMKNISTIPKVPIHIVSGKGDILCREEYAKLVEEALINNGHKLVKAEYIESGHKIQNPPIMNAVRNAIAEFAAWMKENKE